MTVTLSLSSKRSHGWIPLLPRNHDDITFILMPHLCLAIILKVACILSSSLHHHCIWWRWSFNSSSILSPMVHHTFHSHFFLSFPLSSPIPLDSDNCIFLSHPCHTSNHHLLSLNCTCKGITTFNDVGLSPLIHLPSPSFFSISLTKVKFSQ
ncbi:hypothetical protein VNO77_44672 [Canavalia gladiata]|uniref:Uncharacterized protein n=1 Tax=Canavalia gladiata TaxID=3824 RepID=A0AAN9JX43_CANGL